MSIREEIVERTFVPVEVEKPAKNLIDNYHYNKEVYDEDYDLHPLYALLKIMVYAKRCAYVISKKNMSSFYLGNSAANNYILYKAYLNDFKIAYDEFVSHFELNEELLVKLAEIRSRLEKAIAVGYEDLTFLMMDIFDVNSPLYGIEGIEYAR